MYRGGCRPGGVVAGDHGRAAGRRRRGFVGPERSWDNSGTTTVGVYRGNTFYLHNANAFGVADMSISFGNAGDIPLAGDWDGNGTTTIGVYRPSTGWFYLRNSLSAGAADVSFFYGIGGGNDKPVVGNWTGDQSGHKTTTIGVFRSGTWYLQLQQQRCGGRHDRLRARH
jgi:hypothetical protein